ncbi:SusC/RagA family TonB-linked outer membrane protein [Rufibacter immobilis]|uniref:SusC/RagA family TonB-linked outer membrane protein n=1 Tax=Rufibacter immobilis TaxID=1348778 RepID=UPI0035E8B8D5
MKQTYKLPFLLLLVASMSLPGNAQMLANLREQNPGGETATEGRLSLSPSQEVTLLEGKVTSNQGEPLIGVTVVLKGTTTAASTDVDGNFKLKLPSSATSSAILVFTFIGFSKQEVPVNGKSRINVTLLEDNQTLDEVVVVGFGTQKKANLTGAVSTIDAKALESRPVQNVGQALQGLIPGLNFQTSGLGGELNQNLSFNIRGAGTIGAGSNSSPLVLIDNMEGNLNAINPQDIESVTVLKDAAAASIYGSRAPFGVILITTKKGKAGKTKVSYNNNFRSTTPIGLPTMMDSHTFALYWNEAAANDGEGPKFSQTVLDRIVRFQNGEITEATVPNANGTMFEYYTGSNANTDWFKEQYKKSSFSQDHTISLNGGSENTQFFASAGFLDQGGLSRFAGDEFQRYTITGKINSTFNKYVKFNYTTRYVREDFTKATHMNDLYYHNIARRWPTVPAKDPNGYFSDPSEIAQLIDGGRIIDQTDWLYQQGQLTVTPAKGWSITADGNFRITNNNYHRDVTPAFGYDVNQTPYSLSVAGNSAGYSSVYEYARKDNYFTTNIYSNYEFKVGENHQFKVLGGFNSELNKYRTLGASRSGIITPELPTINTSTNDTKAEEGQYQHWATAGFFSRLNYDYKGRYLLELNGRYDGTSRFTRDKRWNLFPSFSVGWNVAEESFWAFDKIQMLKLRASYGELGNQNTGNWYPFYPTMPVSANNGNWLINGQKPNTAGAPGLVSSLLTWERVTSWNAGVDLAMLNNRLMLNLDYYKRKTIDMVGPAPELPVTLGTGVPQINNADMESYGFEIEAKWQDRIGEVGYSVRGVLSDDQQRVTRYPNTTGNLSTWYEGRKVGEIWGYTTVGIAKTKEEMEAYLAKVNQAAMGGSWGAGDIMYADLNNDGKVNSGAGTLADKGDRSIIGNSSPRFRFSLDLTGDWKGFDMRIFLQGVGKRDYMPNGPYFWGASGGMWQSAGFEEHMDFFRDENSGMVKAGKAGVNLDSYFPKPYFNTGKNQQTQTRYIQNAAYLRLKNLQFGYTIPTRFTSMAGVSKVRLYVSGENLLTFTKLTKIFDPETIGLSGWNDGKVYPLSRVVSGGLSVNF